jgi:hypothetical protein
MSRQDQRIGDQSTGVQAARDVIIQVGISPEQMTEIMVHMGKQLAFYQLEAKQRVEDRLISFRDEILKKFTQPGQANPEAFRDPDFQYLLGDAQTAYARSGDQAVRDTLVDIIARRSLETGRSRIAVTLNDAATKAPLLTINEFAELSLVYTVRYTQNNSITNFVQLCKYVSASIIPFINDVSRENSSYWHLEAQSCAAIDITELSLFEVWKQMYGGVLCRGFDRDQLERHLPEGQKNALDKHIIQCIQDNTKLQPDALNRQMFRNVAAGTGLTVDQLDNVWNLFENTIYAPGFELLSLFAPQVPDIGLLFDLWQNTPLKNLKLNSVGIAIGHANAVRVTGLGGPLGGWIK